MRRCGWSANRSLPDFNKLGEGPEEKYGEAVNFLDQKYGRDGWLNIVCVRRMASSLLKLTYCLDALLVLVLASPLEGDAQF
jgi:hypothetical protein